MTAEDEENSMVLLLLARKPMLAVAETILSQTTVTS
jgi:hypothetical protein